MHDCRVQYGSLLEIKTRVCKCGDVEHHILLAILFKMWQPAEEDMHLIAHDHFFPAKI
jgi:hypothetical protein